MGIFKPFKTLLSAWWCKISSWCLNEQIGHFMWQLGAFICALSILVCCSTIKNVPISTTYKEINYLKDTVIIFQLPIESVKECVPITDTLFMETSVASSKVYLDTLTNSLKGKLENKKDTLKKEIQIIEKEVQVFKDIPVIQEKIIERVPKWSWYTLGFCIIFVLVFIIKIYLKFKI